MLRFIVTGVRQLALNRWRLEFDCGHETFLTETELVELGPIPVTAGPFGQDLPFWGCARCELPRVPEARTEEEAVLSVSEPEASVFAWVRCPRCGTWVDSREAALLTERQRAVAVCPACALEMGARSWALKFAGSLTDE